MKIKSPYSYPDWLVLIISLWLLSFPVHAMDREEFNSKLIAMEKQKNKATEDSFAYLDELIETARRNNWEQEEVFTASIKVSFLRKFSRFSDAEVIIEQYFERAKGLKDKMAQVNFLYALLSISNSRDERESAQRYQKTLLSLVDSQEPLVRAWIFLNVSQSQVAFEDYQAALTNLQKALVLFESLDVKKGVLSTINSIAVIYSRLNQQKKSIEYYEKALKVAQSEGEALSESILLFNIGESYFNLKDFKSALPYLQEALVKSQNLNDELGIAYVLRILAEVKLEEGKFEDAYKQINQAAAIFSKLKMSTMLLLSGITKLQILLKSNRIDEAAQVLESLDEPTKERAHFPYLIKYYLYAYEIKKLQGDSNAALRALEEHMKFSKEQFEDEKNQSIDELMIKFDSARKENENRLLMQENEINELRLIEHKKQKTIWILSFLFVASTSAIVILFLIGQVKRRNRFRHLALKDELTNAPNRRAILEQAKRHFKGFQKSYYDVTIAILDIDYFKNFNDKYGHDTGDEVLKILAKACDATLRNKDFYGRYGGEEWLLVMVDAKIEDVQSVFERLSIFLRNADVPGLSDDETITFSLGAAQANGDDKDLKSVIKRADENLYKAKELGRNRLIV